MLKPIKRVWIPKAAPAKPADPVQQTPPAPVRRNMLFDEMPQPDAQEKNSDSVWAEFDSVPPLEDKRK